MALPFSQPHHTKAGCKSQSPGLKVGHWHIQPSPIRYPEPSSAHTSKLGQQGTHHHLPQLRTGNSRGLSHSSATQISSNSPPACATEQGAPPALLLPSDSTFSSLRHTLPQAPRVFQVLQSRVRDQEGWQRSRADCAARPRFATAQRRAGNNTQARTHIRRLLPLTAGAQDPTSQPGLLSTIPRTSLPSGGSGPTAEPDTGHWAHMKVLREVQGRIPGFRGLFPNPPHRGHFQRGLLPW